MNSIMRTAVRCLRSGAYRTAQNNGELLSVWARLIDYGELKRDGNRIKTFSNWPTIPQVFINGEFFGGCDILLQMHQSGDLVEELQKLGIRSALLDQEKESK
uniref:Glutaredoxin 5 homolog (S. cerevisiae) n=1 Tax=Sinocyclocheilus grahami TaxID=75366 RepID=A0A672MW54_SINGR